VVAACSYEARRFGIHSAMPCSRAYQLCPQAVFLPPRFDAYRECSGRIQAIFRRFTPLIEPLSLDEAFLDVSASGWCQGSATLIAREIKGLIRAELDLVASAGVSYNKFLAKIASDMDKPDGLTVIRPEQAQATIDGLPIRRFFGVGKVTEQKMHRLGIFTGADLKALGEAELVAHFGSAGPYYHRIARGIDHRPVRSERRRKSIGAETTFAEDLVDMASMEAIIDKLAGRVYTSLCDQQLCARTVTLKVKYHDFRQITRSTSPAAGIHSRQALMAALRALADHTEMGRRPVRLLGVSLSGLAPPGAPGAIAERQLPLFS
jgi:DNA polymerase-4